MADDEYNLFSLTILTRLYSFPGLSCLGHLLVQTQAAETCRVQLHLVHLQHRSPGPAFTEMKTEQGLDEESTGLKETQPGHRRSWQGGEVLVRDEEI